MEEWRDIVGHDGRYQVSNLGRVRSTAAVFKGGRVLAQSRKQNGYLQVRLCGLVNTYANVHRLVAEAFVSLPPSSRHQVNHIDGNKENNRYRNLEWLTPSENRRHAIHVLKRGNFDGHNHQAVILINRSTQAMFEFRSLREAGDFLGVTYHAVANAMHKGRFCKGHRVERIFK